VTSTQDLSKLVMELREKTGAGMMDCKKALTAANGNLELALTELRKKGLADAAKKAGRATKEGQVEFVTSGKAGALIELNCETDFVARNEDFQKLAATLAQKAASGELKSLEDAQQYVQPVFTKLGENMALRRFERFELSGAGLIAGYAHRPDGKVSRAGALLELTAPSEAAAKSPELAEFAKELLLQIVGSPYSPKWLTRQEVPAAEIEKEKEIHAAVLRKEGKPDAQIPKIVEGKLNKLFYQQVCLLEQVSVRDNKTSIAGLLDQLGAKLGGKVTVRRFARYQLGG
jgi:elongation factor Ts